MTARELLDILSVAEKLKCNTRHGWTSSGRHESVAEHSWRLALMAMLLSHEEEFRDVDTDKVISTARVETYSYVAPQEGAQSANEQ